MYKLSAYYDEEYQVLAGETEYSDFDELTQEVERLINEGLKVIIKGSVAETN